MTPSNIRLEGDACFTITSHSKKFFLIVRRFESNRLISRVELEPLAFARSPTILAHPLSVGRKA